jgi:hypothetical protein
VVFSAKKQRPSMSGLDIAAAHRPGLHPDDLPARRGGGPDDQPTETENAGTLDAFIEAMLGSRVRPGEPPDLHEAPVTQP